RPLLAAPLFSTSCRAPRAGSALAEPARVRRLPLPASCLLSLLLAAAVPAAAGEAQRALGVSAQVPARVEVALTAPVAVALTAADLARGYVDVPQPVRLDVAANTPRYLLQVGVQAPWVEAVELGGLAFPARVGAPGGWLAQPRGDRSRVTLNLTV